MTKREPFTNQSIKAPRQYKPHICLRDGWWRVSAAWRVPANVLAQTWPQWNKAHNFVNELNIKSRR